MQSEEVVVHLSQVCGGPMLHGRNVCLEAFPLAGGKDGFAPSGIHDIGACSRHSFESSHPAPMGGIPVALRCGGGGGAPCELVSS